MRVVHRAVDAVCAARRDDARPRNDASVLKTFLERKRPTSDTNIGRKS
jgi:hypothetical protein